MGVGGGEYPFRLLENHEHTRQSNTSLILSVVSVEIFSKLHPRNRSIFLTKTPFKGGLFYEGKVAMQYTLYTSNLCG